MTFFEAKNFMFGNLPNNAEVTMSVHDFTKLALQMMEKSAEQAETDLSVRVDEVVPAKLGARYIMQEAHCTTMQDVFNTSRLQLSQYRNIGNKSISFIQEYFRKQGLKW